MLILRYVYANAMEWIAIVFERAGECSLVME